MPPEQSRVFNQYISLMNQANVVLPRYIHVLAAQADLVSLRQAWLTSLILWQEHIDEIRRAVRVAVKEPITQSHYDTKLAAARAEWVPVVELAAYLAGQREDWSENDYENSQEWGRDLTEAAWNRAVEEQEKRLRALAAKGSLASRGKGRALKIQQGAFDEALGHCIAAVPEDNAFMFYRVVPDDEAEAVSQERAHLHHLQSVLDWRSGSDDADLPKMPEMMIDGLKQTTAYMLISAWVELGCVDAVLAGIAAEFGIEDALRPKFRERLEETRQKLRTSKEHLLVLGMDVVLREPLAEELDELHGWVREQA
jgi:hypothetical protein